MTTGPQLFKIDSESRDSERIQEVDFARLGLRERRDIQEWVAANPGILGDDLLIVGKEFSGFEGINERLDLLAVDADGRLIIIELKRDDTGADAHWQAIKYASYLSAATQEDIIRMLARHENVSEEEAVSRLLQHLDSDDLNELNNDQRIILASHRFAPQVTSAVLWLNEKAPDDDLITCIQLTPHHDAESDLLYIQVNTIVPVPVTEDLTIGIGVGRDSGSSRNSSLGEALRKSFTRSRMHEATPFLRRVGDIVLQGILDTVRPNRRSRWAGQGVGHRYYHLWYRQRPPWGNWKTSYRIDLYEGEAPPWRANVHFATNINGLMDSLHDSNILTSFSIDGETLDEFFANKIADSLKPMIESITPAVDTFMDQDNEEQS